MNKYNQLRANLHDIRFRWRQQTLGLVKEITLRNQVLAQANEIRIESIGQNNLVHIAGVQDALEMGNKPVLKSANVNLLIYVSGERFAQVVHVHP